MPIVTPLISDFNFDEHQIRVLNEIEAKESTQRIVVQYPTGGGKTVMFSSICASLTARYGKDFKILILVHRKELLSQFSKTYLNLYREFVSTIEAGKFHKKYISNISVGMIETFHNRIENLGYNPNLIIIDEAHRGDFLKVITHDNFEFKKLIGFTATPIFATKDMTMKDIYGDIIVGPSIQQLIELGRLVPCMIFEPENILDILATFKKKWGVNGLDYDLKELSAYFNSEKRVATVYEQWNTTLKRSRTLVFCCTIEHAHKVYAYFKAQGHQHCLLITSKDQDDRVKIESYIKQYEDAAIINVDVLTTGFDSPLIRSLIVARSTLSLTLYLQIIGRALRSSEDKEFATIIDLGGNVRIHGDPTMERDWNYLFNNPKEKNPPNVAPLKSCKNCSCLNAIQARVCKNCEHPFPIKNESESQYEMELKVMGFRLYGNYDVNLDRIKNNIHKHNHKTFKGFYDILAEVYNTFRKEKVANGSYEISNEEMEHLWDYKVRNKMLEYNKVEIHGKQWGEGFFRKMFYEQFPKMAVATNFTIVEKIDGKKIEKKIEPQGLKISENALDTF